MNTKAVFHLIAYLLMVVAIAMFCCWGISIYYDDPVAAKEGLFMGALITLAFACVISLITRHPIDLSRRDGFGIVTFGWISVAIFGALPFILSGVIPNPVGAVFETMSGFTTTGASVLTDLEQIPKGILLWRATTHLFGGMGVLVLCVAILPFLGVGGMQIFRAEVPGPAKDRLTPRIASTAKLLWAVYVLFCLIETILLKFGGMTWFDAWCHTCATMATGGFSTRTASIGAYNSVYIDVVIIIFMFLAGANFSLHYRALQGNLKAFWKNPEFKFYFFTWLIACLLLTFNIWKTAIHGLGESLRAAFFTGTSIMTTTGFATADFELWPSFAKILIVILMFLGGCAGSTGGGIKSIRIFILLKSAIREMRVFMRPHAVVQIKIGKKPIEASVVSHITAFFVIYVILFVLISFIMCAFTPDLTTAITSSAATLGNIGPGLGAIGPTMTYADIPNAGLGILIFAMLLGRLELYTVLLLLLPRYWKK